MKIMPGILLISLISLNCIAQSKPDAIPGKWMTPESSLEVEVYKQNNSFKANVIWFDDNDDKTKPMNERMDEKNPDNHYVHANGQGCRYYEIPGITRMIMNGTMAKFMILKPVENGLQLYGSQKAAC
jgi:hypothetical protein